MFDLALRGPGVFLFFYFIFFDRQDLYLCGDRVLVLGYTEYVGGSTYDSMSLRCHITIDRLRSPRIEDIP